MKKNEVSIKKAFKMLRKLQDERDIDYVLRSNTLYSGITYNCVIQDFAWDNREYSDGWFDTPEEAIYHSIEVFNEYHR